MPPYRTIPSNEEPQVLTLELSDEVYAALQQQAKILGIDLSELVTTSLERQYRLTKAKDQRTEAEKEAARQRFRAHAGSISGYPTGADNESIDADLGREYGDTHEET